jgi:hypothetical protein
LPVSHDEGVSYLSPVSTLRSLTRAAPSSATVFSDRRQIAKSWSTLGSTRDAAVSCVSRRTTQLPSSNGSRLHSSSPATSMPTAPIAMAAASERAATSALGSHQRSWRRCVSPLPPPAPTDTACAWASHSAPQSSRHSSWPLFHRKPQPSATACRRSGRKSRSPPSVCPS